MGVGREDRRTLILVFVVVLLVMSIPSVYFSAMISTSYLSAIQQQPDVTTTEMMIGQPPPPRIDTRPLVAVVVCTKSSASWRSVNSTSIKTLLLPSIQKTTTAVERARHRLQVVVGFDTHDAFWENPKHRQDLQDTTNIPINYVAIPKHPDRPHQIPFNAVCRAAYEYGAEYLVRVNDDSEFKTAEWITKSIARLRQYRPPFVGVVGPTCRQGNTQILTHDFVHRTHLDIFKDYYPNEFDNWWIDDWITAVYGANRTTKLPDWEVFHHVGKHGTRYKVTPAQKNQLTMTVERGGKRIQSFLQNRTEEPGTYRVLGTNRISHVWGPMAGFHHPLSFR